MLNAISNQTTFKNFRTTPEQKQAGNFAFQKQSQQAKKEEVQNNKKTNLIIAAASLAGAIIPLMLIRKHQGIKIDKEKLFTNLKGQLSEIKKSPIDKNEKFQKGVKAVFDNLKNKYAVIHKSFFDTETEAKEMIMMSLGSLGAGFAAGMITDKEKSPKKNKSRIKDFVFQAFNVSIPTLLTGALLSVIEKNRAIFKKQKISKFLAIATGVGAGMPVATIISNKINKTFIDPNDKGRKIHPKNYLVHTDDAVAALALAKVPFADNLPVKEVLPLIFANCGYETGKGEEE